jgi:Tfp pilus assembly protein PilX
MEKQRGQIALIALLVLTIATTVGLSLIARSTTDVSVTRNLEESNRAFSAAEAGVEETLKSGVASSGTIDTNLGVSYSVTIASPTPAASAAFVFPQKTLDEEIETVWLVGHNGNAIVETPTYIQNSIDVCWSSETVTPALVVTMLYKRASDSTYQVAEAAFDPNSSRAATNNFDPPTATTGGCGAGTNTTYRSTMLFANYGITPSSDILIALRIHPVYSAAQIAVTPLQALPIQGNQIQSVGTTGSGISRKIIVNQQYRSPLSIFNYSVYSQNSFSH